MPAVGLTALQGIDDHLRVAPGEDVIIVGASGGVGHLALQIAKARLARVLAVASGARGVALARRLGADDVADGHDERDLAAALERFTPDGADALLALAGGPALDRCLRAVAPGGRVACPNGVEPAPRRRSGVELVAYDAVTGRRQLDRLGRVVDDFAIEVVIAEAFPLDQAQRAHERIEGGGVLGKVVLRIR
jgi:NADPH:quinone reductase-like Zn-dependent oxidoreductase